MSKRDDGYGFIRSRAATAGGPLPRSFGLWKRVWRPRRVLSRLRADMMSTLICSRCGGGRARTGALASGPAPATRQADEVHFAAVSIAPERQTLMACSEHCGAIEIEFAAGVRMRITGAVDAATLRAAVAALSDGRPR